MRIIVGLVAMLPLMVSNAALAQNLVGGGQLSVKQLRGSFGYQISGTFVESGITAQFDEVGVFNADGNGNITATGKSVLGFPGSSVPVNPSYTCTYKVDAPPLFSRGFHATCTRTQEVSPTSASVEFEIVLDDAGQQARILALPSVPPFNQVSITGTAHTQ